MLGIVTCMARGATRRRMTGKFGRKDYYKGVGCAPTGFHTKHGGYVVLQNRIPEYIVPDLKDCKLKPYVSRNLESEPVPPVTKEDYLKLLMQANN